MDFAIIETGGKQFKVSKGDVITIEKLSDKEYKEGDKLQFSNVLLLNEGNSPKIGAPLVDKAKVKGTIKEIGKAKKVDVVHYKSKINYFKRYGHRQPFFRVEINSIG